MFGGCKLDLESVQCIANTINDVKNITYSSDFMTKYNIDSINFKKITIGAAPAL